MLDNKYNVLLVDDREDFSESFKREAQVHNIMVASRTNYKDMVEFLPKIKDKISMIILDIKCLKDPDQQVENEDFLALALSHLDQNYAYIPRVILTADSVKYDFVKNWFSKEKIYRKTKPDIYMLFEEIKEKGDKIEQIKMRWKYNEVFSIFDRGYLPKETENDLLDLLFNMNNSELCEIKKNLSSIRRIQEKVLQTINKRNKVTIPDSYLKPNKDISFRRVHKHLSGNKTKENNYNPTTEVYYDGVIEILADTIYKISSDNGAHTPYEDYRYMPSIYTVQAIVYGLLDFLLWFDSIMETGKECTKSLA